MKGYNIKPIILSCTVDELVNNLSTMADKVRLRRMFAVVKAICPSRVCIFYHNGYFMTKRRRWKIALQWIERGLLFQHLCRNSHYSQITASGCQF